jgi:hypothetical protein
MSSRTLDAFLEGVTLEVVKQLVQVVAPGIAPAGYAAT